MLELKDRFKKFLDHYNLSPDTLSKKIGGSRGTYFSIQNGKSKPDYNTTENILSSFPELSAEWWFRGSGPMLKGDIVSAEDAEALIAENKAIKALYRAELQGKTKGASNHPQVDREGASDLLTRVIQKNMVINNLNILKVAMNSNRLN